MIKLKTELLEVPQASSIESIGERLNMTSANLKVNSWIEPVEAQIMVQVCPNGHIPQGIITMMALVSGEVLVTKEGFCCKELEDAFHF